MIALIMLRVASKSTCIVLCIVLYSARLWWWTQEPSELRCDETLLSSGLRVVLLGEMMLSSYVMKLVTRVQLMEAIILMCCDKLEVQYVAKNPGMLPQC